MSQMGFELDIVRGKHFRFPLDVHRERERERNQVPFVLLLFFFVFFLWFEELSMILFSQTKPFMAADGGFGFASIKKSKDNKDNDDDDDDDDDGN